LITLPHLILYYLSHTGVKPIANVSILEQGETKEFEVTYDEIKSGELLGKGRFGIVRKVYHPPSQLTFAVKMIEDKPHESGGNAGLMDMVVPLTMGNKCPYLIKFYGALHAEVRF
jgi:hypothetical protein